MATTKTSPFGAVPNWKAPSFIYHSTFEGPEAEKLYGSILSQNDGELVGFMLDEATRDWTKRMHYAAWRASKAATAREVSRWWRRYYDCRDRVVLGNRKLTFRAVQKWRPATHLVEDLAAECQVVLIKAVAAFNPWLGIRFSTYVFTCLLRALSRISQRQAADRVFRRVSLDSLPFGEPPSAEPAASSNPEITTLEKYLRAENPLLTEREKSVLVRRYCLHEDASKSETLEQVGKELGLSKERVRQLQMSALGKLRQALLAT